MGLTDGESLERVWSLVRHVIPSMRVSTFFSRIQILSHLFLHQNENKQLALGATFQRLMKTALERIKENKALLQGVNIREILEQTKKRKEHFEKPRGRLPKTVDDDICEALIIREHYEDEFIGMLRIGEEDITQLQVAQRWLSLKNFVLVQRFGRFNSQDERNILDSRLQDMLSRSNQELSDWRTPQGPTQKYLDHLERWRLRELRELKFEMHRILVLRRCELGLIRRSAALRGISNKNPFN